MSITTKEAPSALQDLLKAKGNAKDVTKPQPAIVAVETPATIEAPATPAPDPEPAPAEPATPVQDQEPVDTRDYKQAHKELKQLYDTEIHKARLQLQVKDRLLDETKRPALKAPKTAEELKVFKEQFPEAYDNIKSMILETLSDDTLDINKQAKEVLQAQAKLREETAFVELKKAHPDADEIKKDPKFATWYFEQPEEIQKILATSTDHKAISKQLTLYKIEMGIPTQKEKQKAEIKEKEDASLAVKVKGQSEISPQKKIWTATEIQQINAGGYNNWLKYRVEIDNARREGRVDETK